MIRVLHCMAGLGRGGYETLIMNIYRKIDRDKIQFDFLYSFDGIYCEEIESLGGRLYKIPFITQQGPFGYRKDLLNFFASHPEYRIVHSHMDKFSGLVMECAKIKGVPVRIAHSHNTDSEGGLIYHAVKDYYGKKIKNSATHRIACSKAAGKWLFGEDDFLILKNGIDGEKYRGADNRDQQYFTIGHVGRFTQQKNHTFLIDIFQKLLENKSEARLLLAGTGPLSEEIKRKTEKLGIAERVTFFGDVEDIPGFLSRCDVFCLPSLFEGLGIALVEAQAAGLYCVASDSVPRDVNFSGCVEFLPLSAPRDKWASRIEKQGSKGRRDNLDKLFASGYDISRSASFLQEYYAALCGESAEEAPV